MGNWCVIYCSWLNKPSSDGSSTSGAGDVVNDTNANSDWEKTNTTNCEEDVADITPPKKIKKTCISKIQEQFSWLDPTKPHLYCKICHFKINGTKFHATRHAQSSSHQKNARAAKMTPGIKSVIVDPEKEKLNVLIKEAELRMTVYLCEHNLAFLLSDTLPTFCQSIFPDSPIAGGLKMKRKKATKLIVGVIAPFFQTKIASELKTSKFSIIIDETTDVSTKKSLILIVRYWKDGAIQDRIFDLIEVKDASATAIFNSIKNVLDANHIPYENIIGFGADNASTMMGHLGGVQAKLKTLSPNIYVQGCSSHSLHLCASNAAKKLPSTVEQFTRDVYGYFAHSSKRLEELQECQIFAVEKPKKILHPSQTRWLSLRVSECVFYGIL